jgi:hypothetical protein
MSSWIIKRMQSLAKKQNLPEFSDKDLETKLIEKGILDKQGKYPYSELMFYSSNFGISDYEKTINIMKEVIIPL